MLTVVLQEQLAAWKRRPALRFLYEAWFEELRRCMATVPGRNLEVGVGIGRLKAALPELAGLDIEATPWTDLVGDARNLPFRNGSLANIVCFDVLHHIPQPVLFFREAGRALAPGGRILIMDPYVSPVSWIVYSYFHSEGLSMNCNPFDETTALCSAEPFDSNQATATCMFFKDNGRFGREFPNLRVVERRRLAMLAYPCSGGFFGRTLLPSVIIRILNRTERFLSFFAPLLAFRTIVVIERHGL